MSKLSVNDLQTLREDVRKNLYLADGRINGKIIIHMGTCGIAAGAKSIESTFLTGINKKKIKDFMLITTGCAGFCSKEPMATVELMHSPPVKYGNLTSDLVEKILTEHVVGGNIVKECLIGIGSERGD